MLRASVFLALSALVAGPVRGQVRAGAGIGATVTSTLVTDRIVAPITLRSDPAPSMALWLGTALTERDEVTVDLRLSRSDLMARSSNGSSQVTPLTTWTPAVSLRRRLGPRLSARITAGALIYHPARRAGTIFQAGAPVIPAIGGGLGAMRRIGRRFALGVELGYDAHRFTTQALRAAGFSGERTIHRVSLTVSWGTR